MRSESCRKKHVGKIDELGLKETADGLATADIVRWYEHVLRWDDDGVLRVAFRF